MKTLYVYACFDWLPAPQLMGELGYESLRGSDSYSFRFDEEWLRNHGSLFISADLRNYPGMQYTLPGRDIFGCFSDALPDRWGRLLLLRREQILASEEQRPIRRLTSFDYLAGIDDFSRMGALRFKVSPNDDYINTTSSLRIPPLADIKSLVAASHEVERSEERNTLPEKRWIQQLVHPGSSLGGARPKAGVLDNDGHLCVAKFPSRNDDYDVALWEHLCHLLAREAGIAVADTSVLSVGEHHHVFLSRRFDRTDDGHRRHFASAMTLLGLTDGCNAATGNGYLDIVDFILQHCCDVEWNLLQLYRRVAFNIAVGNSDDHFRNHGFLLTSRGWTLAPAYDMNPTLNTSQSILINRSSNAADLGLLLESSDEYMIPRDEGHGIIQEVLKAVAKWQTIARRLKIPQREIDYFSDVFNRNDTNRIV